MAPKKKIFTHQQLCKKLDIQAYIVTSWEKQFDIQPILNNGKPVYTRHDLAKFKSIKELLYDKGFSIDAAKKYLQDKQKLDGATLFAASPLLFKPQPLKKESADSRNLEITKKNHLEKHLADNQLVNQQLVSQLIDIKKQLIRFSNSL